jgi:hypothetical protein
MEPLTKRVGSGPGELAGGAESIAAERLRQVEAEGWSAEHDAGHREAELARAALAYLTAYLVAAQRLPLYPGEWPWSPEFWKPSEDPARNLVKAGALIAAEIDRLQRSREP